MFNKIVFTMFSLCLMGQAHATVVSNDGRADLKLAFDQSKDAMPNRHAGVLKDLTDVRAGCDVLKNQAKSALAAKKDGLQVRMVNNQQLVGALHDQKLEPSLIAHLQNNRKLINQALQSYSNVLAVNGWVIGTAINTYTNGNGPQIHEPLNFSANMVGIFDDLISTIRTNNFGECINIVNDIIGRSSRSGASL